MAKIYRHNSAQTVRIAQPFNSTRLENRVVSILRSGRLVQGKTVRELEEALSRYIGSKNTVCLNSGTAALHSACFALKMKEPKKTEVITTALSFAATANAVIHSGCKPVFVDISEETFNIDPALIQEKINEHTLAIEPVDVYGLPSDLTQIKRIAEPNGIPLLEDAAEAIGAIYSGKKIGTISTLTCFSTYATKNLHTAEGGFVTTEDDDLAHLIRLFRNQGQESRYNQTVLGYNFRMTEISAAIGLEQVPILDRLNKKRRENALYLKENLSKIESLEFQRITDAKSHAWYMFSLTLNERIAGMSRDSLVVKLREKGVEADVAWPTPIPLQPYFKDTFGFKVGDFPRAETVCKSIFQLPIQPQLRRAELDEVVTLVKETLNSKRS
jgi:perosamine synthetase